MENDKKEETVKTVRMSIHAINIIRDCAGEIKSPRIIMGLQTIIWGLEKIAKRAIETKDPIILEELANLMVISMPIEQRRTLIKECREIQPEKYNYEI